MLKEGLEYAATLVRLGMKPEKIEDPTGLKDRYWAFGEFHSQPARVAPRSSEVMDLETLALFDAETSEVWFDGGQVRLVEENGKKFVDSWSMNLSSGDAFAFIKGSNWHDQKTLIHNIVTKCKREIDESLLQSLRDLKFAVSAEQTGTVENVSAKMGKSIASEVTGANAIPESFTIEVRRWKQFDISVVIDVLIQFDTERGLIRFYPTESSMSEADRSSMSALNELIGEHISKATICHGRYRA